MISVIVPVYNVEKYLRRCIDSIIAQTCKDLEIILVDDGSVDTCPRICDEYAAKDDRIRVIHKENGGLSDARNTGIDHALGEFIGFVDGDDYILPQMYEALYDACMNRNVSVAMCGRRLVNEKDETIMDRFCMDGIVVMSAREAIESLLMDDCCDSASWDKLYRKSLFTDLRYPPGVQHEDLNVTARIFYRAGKVCHVGQALYVYVRRPGSITNTSFHKGFIDAVRQAELLKEFLDDEYPDIKKKSSHFVAFQTDMVLTLAYGCRRPEMREDLELAADYGRHYARNVLSGRWTMRHKLWFCKKYLVLRIRLWKWKRLALTGKP